MKEDVHQLFVMPNADVAVLHGLICAIVNIGTLYLNVQSDVDKRNLQELDPRYIRACLFLSGLFLLAHKHP